MITRSQVKRPVATEVEILPVFSSAPSGHILGYTVSKLEYYQTFEQTKEDTVRTDNNHIFKTFEQANEWGCWWAKNA